jgi:hypothetical protein
MAIDNYYISCLKYVSATTFSNSNRYIKTLSSTPINGYIGSQNDSQILDNGKYTIKTQYKFFTNDFEIKYGDVIEYENNKYEIISSPKNTVHKNNHIRVMLQKIEQVKQ